MSGVHVIGYSASCYAEIDHKQAFMAGKKYINCGGFICQLATVEFVLLSTIKIAECFPLTFTC